MSEAHDRQKSYADQRRRPLEFLVGDHVFLRVSPTKGVKRFGLKGKLAPRYIGPFEILERVGEVAYLALPPTLAVFSVLHVSMLRKYISHPSHILREVPVPLSLTHPMRRFRCGFLTGRSDEYGEEAVRLCLKVRWQHHTDEEATWELEDVIRARYPHLFA
ncbi:uncharacterized protein LOC141819419 [Curcuma longa]|uniref:uncharacterized protein LOC141819419 n=1 Tax=Curcuma longa TaxID=136217 RepID=UPI003D9EFEE6